MLGGHPSHHAVRACSGLHKAELAQFLTHQSPGGQISTELCQTIRPATTPLWPRAELAQVNGRLETLQGGTADEKTPLQSRPQFVSRRTFKLIRSHVPGPSLAHHTWCYFRR